MLIAFDPNILFFGGGGETRSFQSMQEKIRSFCLQFQYYLIDKLS
jgi:hypothetical protein